MQIREKKKIYIKIELVNQDDSDLHSLILLDLCLYSSLEFFLRLSPLFLNRFILINIDYDLNEYHLFTLAC